MVSVAPAGSGAAQGRGPTLAAPAWEILDGINIEELKRLCLVLMGEMDLVVEEKLDYGSYLDLKLQSTVLLRPRSVLVRLTTAPVTQDDLAALVRDGNDGGCADYLLLSTAPSQDELVRSSQHYLGPDELLDLCRRSHTVGWIGHRPVARSETYLQARRRAAHLIEVDTLGLSWLPALCRNRLPRSLRDSAIPANEWFEIAVFRLITRLFRIDGLRLGAATRGKRVGDALLWWQGNLALLDCKAAQDGYRLEVDDERRLVEYAKQRQDGLPVDGQIRFVVLISSSFPVFDADRRRFRERRRAFTDVGSDLACIRADDLVDAALVLARNTDDTRSLSSLPWCRLLAEGIVARSSLIEAATSIGAA